MHTDKQRLNTNADELISVTVDASDLNAGSAEPLRNILSRYGRPVASRAFGDFQQPILAELAVQFYQMGFTLVHCPTWPNGDGYPKSVVSDVMAQDLRDQLEDLEEVETFLLVATSRDYIAVANALKRHDRRVVVVAEEAKVCRELRMCADEFAILPPSRPERVGRYSEAARLERAAEAARAERTPESPRAERAVERAIEPPRAERPAEPSRPERVPEPARQERAAEPARAERTESQDSVRLPSDSEVLAEVRKIVAAEGICTPRRLARALCPVDRTATGELRSRIANRIQALVDSGKLQRERLVVGGTSVETILTRDEKNGKTTHAASPEASPAPAGLAAQDVVSEPEQKAEPETVPAVEHSAGNGVTLEQLLSEVTVQPPASPQPERSFTLATDLDALVESVLRAPSMATELLNRDKNAEPKGEPKAELSEPEAPQPEPVAAEAAPAKEEAPARTRSRRRTSSKKQPAPEANPAQ